MASRQTIDDVIATWAATFRPTPDNYTPWHASLASTNDQALIEAARWIVDHDDWFPKPARIHEIVRMHNRPSTAPALPVGSQLDRAEQNRMNRYGSQMTATALSGHGTVWVTSYGTETLVTEAGESGVSVVFDWFNDSVTERHG